MNGIFNVSRRPFCLSFQYPDCDMYMDLQWNSAWTETSSDISFDTDQTYITDVGNRYYIAGVSPSFFTVSQAIATVHQSDGFLT